jgi:protein-tyrosine phosphatase
MDYAIKNILIDLDMFSRLGPNLSVHMDRHDHFIITAKYLSNFIGAQTVANIAKTHSTKKLVTDLYNFTKKIMDVLIEKLEIVKENTNDKITSQSTNIISIICKKFKLAYIGLPDIKNGGMQGLIETYKTDPLILPLKNAISFMKESIDSIKLELDKLQLEQINDATFPEINFTDEEWEDHMHLIPSFNIEYVGLYEYYINYSLILSLNQLTYTNGINWWDEIIKVNGISIYLGALPIENIVTGRNDLVELQKLNVQAILSAIKLFENTSKGYVYSPIDPIKWRENNFKHYQAPSSDFCSTHIETVGEGVEFMHWNIINGRPIYVHCKSGKSRSLLIVAAYFVKYLGYGAEDAITYIKSKRKQAGFGKKSTKMQVLKRYEEINK